MNSKTLIAAVAISFAALLPAQAAHADGGNSHHDGPRFAVTAVKDKISDGRTGTAKEFASGNFHLQIHHKGRGSKPHYGHGFHGHYGVVPRKVIRRKLRHRGIHQTSPIYLRGHRYVVHGIGPRGAHVRLAFSARDGRFMGLRVIHGPHGGFGGPIRY